ncbi:hypothetical protein MMC26_006599 [Xylographa opegraphella]|nr:hypothetical protein [Xylographa opegraphella]
MSFNISPAQVDYLVSLILETTGYRYFLPGELMNPLDWDSLPNAAMEFVPFPLFQGQGHRHPSGFSEQYRQAVASLRARIEYLEKEVHSEAATDQDQDHEIADGPRLDSASSWATEQPAVFRGGVVLADNYQEMTEEEFRAHHYLLDSYRITYRQLSSITPSPASPRTVFFSDPPCRSSTGGGPLPALLGNDMHSLLRRSVFIEPLPVHDFVVEYPPGEIDTFYGSIFEIMCSDG